MFGVFFKVDVFLVSRFGLKRRLEICPELNI